MSNDFNLSKTEFTAYLDCPLKFYLQKEQHLTTKEGPRANQDTSNHPAHLARGIKWHDRLTTFYQKKAKGLLAGTISEREALNHPYYQLFWQQELHRRAFDPDNWYPLAFEYYCSSPILRGKIDRIDPLGPSDCCLVEYKGSWENRGYLYEELLFYALLVSESESFQQEIGRPVSQVACYFYNTGEWYTREVSPADLSSFREYLVALRSEMVSGNWARKINCSLSSQ